MLLKIASTICDIMKTTADRVAHVVATFKDEHTGASAATLAAAIGCSSSAISQWIAGTTTNIKLDLLFKLADETQFEARWIATGEGPQRPDGDPRKRRLESIYDQLDERGRTAVLRVAEIELPYVTGATSNGKKSA